MTRRMTQLLIGLHIALIALLAPAAAVAQPFWTYTDIYIDSGTGFIDAFTALDSHPPNRKQKYSSI